MDLETFARAIADYYGWDQEEFLQFLRKRDVLSGTDIAPIEKAALEYKAQQGVAAPTDTAPQDTGEPEPREPVVPTAEGAAAFDPTTGAFSGTLNPTAAPQAEPPAELPAELPAEPAPAGPTPDVTAQPLAGAPPAPFSLGRNTPVAGNPYGQYPVSTKFREPGDLWTSGEHPGIDYAVPEGTPVPAVLGGRIVAIGSDAQYGNYVDVQNAKGVQRYAHLSQPGVQKGQMVAVGGNLGLSGSTGKTTGPHVHVETRSPNGILQDPDVVFSDTGYMPTTSGPPDDDVRPRNAAGIRPFGSVPIGELNEGEQQRYLPFRGGRADPYTADSILRSIGIIPGTGSPTSQIAGESAPRIFEQLRLQRLLGGGDETDLAGSQLATKMAGDVGSLISQGRTTGWDNPQDALDQLRGMTSRIRSGEPLTASTQSLKTQLEGGPDAAAGMLNDALDGLLSPLITRNITKVLRQMAQDSQRVTPDQSPMEYLLQMFR